MTTEEAVTVSLIAGANGGKLSKFMDPTNDVAFKRLFGSKRFERLTIHFIRLFA